MKRPFLFTAGVVWFLCSAVLVRWTNDPELYSTTELVENATVVGLIMAVPVAATAAAALMLLHGGRS